MLFLQRVIRLIAIRAKVESGRLRIARRGGALTVLVDELPLPLASGTVGELLVGAGESGDLDELRVLGDAFGHLGDLPSALRPAHQRALDDSLARALERPGTASVLDEHLAGINDYVDVVHELLEQQHHRLAYWRAARDLGYRRFFDVNELIGVRVERPEVFEATHAAVRRWCDAGLVDGLRVDHPDGLRDPKRYLDDLAALTGGAYVLVEKILEPGEELP